MIIHANNCKHTYHIKASILSHLSCNNAYMTTIGEVLKQAREELGISQEDVAAKVRKLTGLTFSRAALAQIESGSTKNPKPHNLQAACDALNIDFRSALKGNIVRITQGQMAATLDDVTGHLHGMVIEPVEFKIPLLSWVRAGEFCEAPSQFTRTDAEEMLPTPLFNTGPNTFALTVRGDSMNAPGGYEEGEIVYIDPDITAEVGNDVLARTDAGMTLKRFKEDELGPYLLALNGNQIIRPTPPWHICGVVVFSGKKRR